MLLKVGVLFFVTKKMGIALHEKVTDTWFVQMLTSHVTKLSDEVDE